MGRTEWENTFGRYRVGEGYRDIWVDWSRRLHLVSTEKDRGYSYICVDWNGRKHLEELGIDVMKLLKLIFKQ